MSVYTQSQITNIINNAPAVDPDVIWRQMGGASYYGDVANATYQNMWYTYENAPAIYREVYLDPYLDAWKAGGGSITPSATEQLVPQAVVDAGGNVTGTKAVRMQQVTTPAGTVKQGAIAGRIPLGTLIGGVAIGAGVGIKELAEHPKFWNDLSNAVFNDLKEPETWISKPFAETETADIIWRCMEDGSIQGYCDKRSVDKVIENLYEYNVLNNGSVTPVIDQPGYQQVSYGALDFSVLMAAANVITGPVSTQALEAAYAGALTYAGSRPYNAISAAVGSSTVSVTLYNMPDYLTIDQYPNGLYVYRPQDYGVVVCNVTYDPDTLEVISVSQGSSYGSTVTIGSVYQSAGNLGFCSNVGSNVNPWNDAVIPNPDAVQAPSDINDFWNTFALWLANSFDVTGYNPITNANETTTYIPFTAPDKNWQIQDYTGNQGDVWSGIYDFVSPFTTPGTSPINNPSPWIFESIGNFTIPSIKTPTPTPWDNNPKFPQPTPTPIGSSPTIVAPTSGVGSGNKLYTVYNPTQAEVDSLGGYLWSQNIIEVISQFFKNNPLEAIISLHMVYCTPTTGTSKHIILGYLDSGVSAAVVTSQYEDLACGYVEIPECYGNALDYNGVSIQIYLPFVGFRPLKTKEVMGKRVEVDYKIDVYTGVCLAMIYVISANTRQLLYTYEGNCSVQIPLTSADRSRLLAGLTTAGVSAFTGNPAGVVGGIASIGTNIERSGGFSGNAGAMGVKKPYVIITRAINAQASHYNKMYGYPLNKYGVLSNFKGFTRCQAVHVDIPDATHDEMQQIQEMLTTGIII